MTTPLPRRTLLKGLGTALALPLLDAMIPSMARGAVAETMVSPQRLAFLFVPNGMNMEKWMPTAVGETLELSPTLAPLAAHRESLTLLSGLTLDGGRPHGDGPGDHARCAASFLTGAHPTKTEGADIRNGISVDQVAAEHIGGTTRFPSLELGSEPSSQSGGCDLGYSCVYTSNISWRTPTSPMGKETNPRAAFARLFGDGGRDERSAAQVRRERDRRSVLDFALDDARALERRLGAADRAKLDEYFYAVRQIERRLEATASETDRPDLPQMTRTVGFPRDFGEHVRLLTDIIVLALATDSTRVATMMFGNAANNRGYPDLDAPEGHHELSHHGGNEEKLAKISRINHYHVTLLAYMLDRMAAVDEGEGSLLDNTLLLYGSGIADGNEHDHGGLPILLAGRGGGAVRGGRHLAYAAETPLTNLYVSMLQAAGAPVDTFSDSTGPLEGLS